MDRLRRKLANVTRSKKNKHMCIYSKSASTLASACTVLLPTRSIIRSYEQSNTPVFQNFRLIWLNTDVEKHTNSTLQETITILRRIVNSIDTFVDVDECIKFIGDIKNESIFLIVSGTLIQTTIPVLHDMSRITSIYIFCEDKLDHELWTHRWPKIKDIFMENASLCEALEYAAQECDRNSLPIRFIMTNNQTTVLLDQSFVHTQIFKEIVVTNDYKEQDMTEFITYYREHILGNVTELENLEKFEREYHDYEPIWWYTYQWFLSSMLTRALCTMEVKTIIKMGFFIRHLHQHINRLHCQQNAAPHDSTSFTVYRGQEMSAKDFDHLKKTQDGLLSFGGFLSTSKNRLVSQNFAHQTAATSDSIGVLFVMTIDPSKASTPFANIRDVRYSPADEEILFSINSVFRIDRIIQIDNKDDRLWEVELTLIDDNDPSLHELNQRILAETVPARQGWCRFTELLIKQNQIDKAQQVCEIVMTQTLDDTDKALVYYQLGRIKFHQEKYEEASSFYRMSREIRQKILSSDHIDIAACYNGVGLVDEKMKEYSRALSSFEKALVIYQKSLPTNDSVLIDCTNNIARVYYQMDQYANSLLYYEKVLKIYQDTIPLNLSDVAAAYKNIGSVYEKTGEYRDAVASFDKVLAIYKKLLPSNHADMAESYYKIGLMYDKMEEYSIALSYYEKSVEIDEEILPSNHPDLAASYNNIGWIYCRRNDYLNALSSYEKAHEIYRQILPWNHPDLAISYTCYGTVYERMGKYTKALLYYKKALEIYENIHPLNSSHLAIVYNNISSVYFQMGENPMAFSFYECALDLEQKLSSENHSGTEQ